MRDVLSLNAPSVTEERVPSFLSGGAFLFKR